MTDSAGVSDFSRSTVALLGMGLLGGSLGLDLAGKVRRIGWTRKTENLPETVKCGMLDAFAETPEAAVKDADFVVLCMPVAQIPEYALRIRPHLKKGALVMDVGSTKGAIMQAVQSAYANDTAYFLGAHPMTGRECCGYAAACAHLYEKAPVFLTPSEHLPYAVLERGMRFWKSVGAEPYLIDAALHDALVAHTSHLPHVLALALTLCVLERPAQELAAYVTQGCAGSFRDCTRVASSSPALWRVILEENRTALLRAMDDFESNWKQIRTAIEQADFDRFESLFEQGKTLRDAWLARRFPDSE